MKFVYLYLSLKITKNIIKNSIKLIKGQKLNLPALGSMTVENDDVKIAKKCLAEPEKWENEEIIKKYEEEFAKWNESKYAFSFSAGRVALSACIYALELKPDDEVIIPAYTCIVVPNAFSYENIKIIYCDIELDTYGLDFADLKKKITPKCKAILIHHLYGVVCRDYEKILKFAEENNLPIIEDCAHSTGAKYAGKKIGNMSAVAFYSSEQSKIFSTQNGGIAVTNEDRLAKKIKEYQNNCQFPDKNRIKKTLLTLIYNYYSIKKKFSFINKDLLLFKYHQKILISTTSEEISGIKPKNYNVRMAAPIAEIGINQLKKIDSFNKKRVVNAKKWQDWCDANSYKKIMIIDNSEPVYLRYPVMIEPERKKNLDWAEKMNIPVGVWFLSNLHPKQIKIDYCPNADLAVQSCINLPTLLDL